MSTTSDATLETPILDSNLPSLLQRVTEEGGYAFASIATRAAAGDARAAEAAKDMAWEQLHSGPWHSVGPIWRDAYSMASLHVAKLHFSSGEFDLALRALDMGLIMGGLTLRDDLNLCIRKVSAAARAKESGDNCCPQEKSEWYRDFNLVEVVKLLPVRSLSCKTVAKKCRLSLEGFLQEHFISGSPVIISDSMNHWPAIDTWNDMNYLKRVAGFRTVPVEVGKNYLSPDWKQELITFSEFLGRIQSSDRSSANLTYLAQHQLFDQVVGKKYIRLYPASLSEELYPHSETMLCNSSQVDLDKIDEKEFPGISDLDFVDCVLEEGEMLYIPPKWWHYVRSLTASFSVSFWWSDELNSPDS
ncbi:hypothetical protein ABFS82_04G055000 [Erythranthe guttata]